MPVHKCSCRETYVDSTEYCTCIARSSWTACHLILHDHQQIRKWTSWCLSSYLQNISCAVHGLTISLAWSETMEGNGYFSIWWASDSTHCLTLNWIPILKSNCHRVWEQHPLRDQIRKAQRSSAKDQRISAGRKMHYWCQHDSINVSMDLVKEPTKLGATIGNEFDYFHSNKDFSSTCNQNSLMHHWGTM